MHRFAEPSSGPLPESFHVDRCTSCYVAAVRRHHTVVVRLRGFPVQCPPGRRRRGHHSPRVSAFLPFRHRHSCVGCGTAVSAGPARCRADTGRRCNDLTDPPVAHARHQPCDRRWSQIAIQTVARPVGRHHPAAYRHRRRCAVTISLTRKLWIVAKAAP